MSLAAPIGASFILQEISCAIGPYERVAIVGASGAGKTSLLRLLNRLNDPTRGEIALQGQPLSQMNPIQLRREVVLVPQEPRLLGMTVRDALAYPLVLQNLPRREIQQRLQTGCDRLRIPEQWWERNELQLSLGQRQLCAIARSLVMQPKILLLDEPTSALDLGTASHLLQVLRDASERQEITLLMVNHQLELLEGWCDRILYLENGQLRQDRPRDRVDWDKLRATLLQLEARAAREWE